MPNSIRLEEWLSGRRRTIGNRVYVISVSGVQIPIPPPRKGIRTLVFVSLSFLFVNEWGFDESDAPWAEKQPGVAVFSG